MFKFPSIATLARAFTTTASSLIPDCIVCIVGMSFWAVRLHALFRSTCLTCISSPNICYMRNWLKMLWVYTGWVVAKMVKLFTIGNNSYKQFIGKTVNWHHPLTFVCMKRTIPTSTFCPQPQPAFISSFPFNLIPKSLSRCGTSGQPAHKWITMSQPTLIMRTTVRMSMDMFVTTFYGAEVNSHRSLILTHNSIQSQ